MFWAISSVFGYDHTKCSYKDIGDRYADDCDYLTLRYVAATFGALLIPLCFLTARELGASRLGALLAGCLVMFDNLNLIESRLILTDSQLMFSIGLAFFVALKFWRRISVGPSTLMVRNYSNISSAELHPDGYSSVVSDKQPPRMSLLERVAWVIAVGATCGGAISVKWTGLATPGLIAVECAFALFFLRRAIPLVDLLGMAVAAAAVYIAPFYLHLQLLTLTGEGDAHMNVAFQKTLEGNDNYDPTAPRPPFWSTFIYLQLEMLRSNAGVDVRHNWESYWWSWPINTRGVMYWDKVKKPLRELIYLLGNPGVVWLVTIVMSCTLLALLVNKRWPRLSLSLFQRLLRAAEPRTDSAISVAGDSGPDGLTVYNKLTPFFSLKPVVMYLLAEYMFAILPYIGVERSCFIYHHMPSLYYGEILTALVLDRAAGRHRRWFLRLVLAAVFVVWLYFSPWVYGTAILDGDHIARRWVASWD